MSLQQNLRVVGLRVGVRVTEAAKGGRSPMEGRGTESSHTPASARVPGTADPPEQTTGILGDQVILQLSQTQFTVYSH